MESIIIIWNARKLYMLRMLRKTIYYVRTSVHNLVTIVTISYKNYVEVSEWIFFCVNYKILHYVRVWKDNFAS